MRASTIFAGAAFGACCGIRHNTDEIDTYLSFPSLMWQGKLMNVARFLILFGLIIIGIRWASSGRETEYREDFSAAPLSIPQDNPRTRSEC